MKKTKNKKTQTSKTSTSNVTSNKTDNRGHISEPEYIVSTLTCSICCVEYETTEDVITNKVTLNEYTSSEITSQTVLEPNKIFYNPCKTHAFCVGCLKHLALSFDNHQIGFVHPFIRCTPTFENEECVTTVGLSNYFMHNDMKKILTPDEFDEYSNHAEKYQFPGFELVKCPRPVVENRQIKVCGAGILVPIELIQTTERGNLIMFCDQNDRCYRKTCYHCQNLVGRRARACTHCLTMNEANDPFAFNHYFYKPNKLPRDGQNMMFRNHELTKDIILNQLKEIADTQNPLIKCFECLVPMQKTEQCNTLTHCGVERCYCCGRSGTDTNDLGDHWDTSGMHGCPRFDHSKYWNDIAKCNFLCQEGTCYGHEVGECKNKNHKQGILNMMEQRKKCQIYHAIFSLLPEMRETILTDITKIPSLKKYIPKYSSADVRTCLPDSLYTYFKVYNTHITQTEKDNYLNQFSPITIKISEENTKNTRKQTKNSANQTNISYTPTTIKSNNTRSMLTDLINRYSH